MNAKNNFSQALENMNRFNRKISVHLERQQRDLPRQVRKIAKKDTMDALRAAYEFNEQYFAGAKNLVACKQGCSNCCHGRVWLTQVEADLIASTYGLKSSRVDDMMDGDTFAIRDVSRPCPFLSKTNQCTVYEVRPLNCRSHFNFEPTNIACEFENADKPMKLINRDTSIPGILTAIGETAQVHGGGGGDIRRFFGESRLDVAVRAPVA